MGLSENPTDPPQNQAGTQRTPRRRPARRPRTRRCLLKWCENGYCPSEPCNAIAVLNAGRRRGLGLAGRLSSATGPQRLARRSGGHRAGAIGSGCASGKNRSSRQPRPPRGSSLRIFFQTSCDRPGCYEGFLRSRRSPGQRFCSKECRLALERVCERERRWQEAQPGSRPEVPLRSPPKVPGADGRDPRGSQISVTY